MFAYYKKYGHEQTICMPASWRPSRSTPGDKVAEHAIDEIVALAGVDRMTIPPPLLKQLAATHAPLPRLLEASAAVGSCGDALVGGGDMSESDFRMALNADVCATTKMAEGINAFVGETLKLEAALKAKLA
jgi:transaldolase